MELAEIGATAKGGVRRLALTDLDRRGRDRVVGWLRGAGALLHPPSPAISMSLWALMSLTLAATVMMARKVEPRRPSL